MNKLKILDVLIGSKCNLACHQCDTRSDIIKDTSYDSSIEQILEGVSLAQKHFEVETYSMLGGEPLLYIDKIEQVVKHIRLKDTKGRIVIPTNGLLLEKRNDKLADLMTTYNVSLYVCNHFAAFEDKTLTNKVIESTVNFAKSLNLSPYDRDLFIEEITGKPVKDSTNFNGNEQVFTNGTIYVWVRDQEEFHSHYHLTVDGPKPFMTNDPSESYKEGCCSPFCSFLKDKKLYKCAALGTLEKFLTIHNALHDPDWQKYLSYKPLNLETATLEEVTDFSNNIFKPSEFCDMCPNSNKHIFKKTPDKVLPIKELR
jgi:organic radical activating enzyme